MKGNGERVSGARRSRVGRRSGRLLSQTPGRARAGGGGGAARGPGGGAVVRRAARCSAPAPFADRAVAALRDPAVQADVADHVTDAVTGIGGGDLVAVRPLVRSLAGGIVGGQAFAALFRRALLQAHDAVVRRGDGRLLITVADLGVLVQGVLERLAPAAARRIGAERASRLFTLHPGGAVVDVVQVARAGLLRRVGARRAGRHRRGRRAAALRGQAAHRAATGDRSAGGRRDAGAAGDPRAGDRACSSRRRAGGRQSGPCGRRSWVACGSRRCSSPERARSSPATATGQLGRAGGEAWRAGVWLARPAAGASPPPSVAGAIGLVALGVLILLEPGATRHRHRAAGRPLRPVPRGGGRRHGRRGRRREPVGGARVGATPRGTGAAGGDRRSGGRGCRRDHPHRRRRRGAGRHAADVQRVRRAVQPPAERRRPGGDAQLDGLGDAARTGCSASRTARSAISSTRASTAC